MSQSSSLSIVLKAGGPRTTVLESEAKSIRDRFRLLLSNPDPSVVPVCWKLDLSCRAWTVPTLKIVLEDIAVAKIIPTVQVLKFDDIIASIDTEQGLAVYEYLSGVFSKAPLVHTLNLSDNAIGTRGLKRLVPLFRLPMLRSLHLENCGMSAEAGDELRELLSPTAMRLTSLSLGQNQMGIQGAKAIGTLLQGCGQLQHFHYAGSRPLVEGTWHLCRGLAILAHEQKQTQLITLDLADCTLKTGDHYDDGKQEYNEKDNTYIDPLVYLAFALKQSPFLQTLILRDGELEVPGLKLLFANVNPRLCVLDIGGNGSLGGIGGELIRNYFIESSSTLRKLVCDSNELGDEGIIPIAMGAAACESICEINLEGNEITELGAKALLLNPIPHLVTLNLQDNMDLPQVYAEKLQSMYATVLVDEDLPEEEEEEEEEDDDDVTDLTSAMAAPHI